MSEETKRSFEAIMESMRKEEALKEGMKNALTDFFDGLKRVHNSKVKAEISTERIRQLEETNPEFAEATQEGFTEEQTKRMLVDLADCFVKQLHLEQLEKSFAMMLFSIKVQKVDFSKFTGAALYEYLLEHDALKELRSPDFKKKYIVSSAAELTVEKGNITFNTAIRKVIEKCNSGTFIEEEVKKAKPEIDAVCEVINQLIDWYMENETDLMGMLMKE